MGIRPINVRGRSFFLQYAKQHLGEQRRVNIYSVMYAATGIWIVVVHLYHVYVRS